MASKPESSFRRGVERYIPHVYKEKMANPYRGGGADCWYSGVNNDLWVEYKYLAKLPIRVPVSYGLTALQLRWLNDRYAEGRNVAVLVGCKEGGVILRAGEWNHPMAVEQFKDRVQPRHELGAFIQNTTGVSPSCAYYGLSTQLRKDFPVFNES